MILEIAAEHGLESINRLFRSPCEHHGNPDKGVRTITFRQAFAGKDFDAPAQAQDAEERIFHEAESLQDYQERCKKFQDEILPDPSLGDEEAVSESEEDETGRSVVAIGPYQDAKFYRDGIFSTIFKASPISSDDSQFGSTLVALKVTTESAMLPPHNSAREVRLLRQASSASVIPLLSTFTLPPGRIILVFPFCRYDLSYLLQHRPQTLTPLLKAQILYALFSALTHIHSLSIIHRDIKPSNILLQPPLNAPSQPPSIYLADFGIAWSPSDHSSSEPAAEKVTDVGTTCYRPPEILFGDTAYDASLDMWAAGCVVAELVRPAHEPLFDAGPVGSELGLIKSIFETLGTPDEHVWPSTSRLPDWHKMSFHRYPGQPWDKIIPPPPPSSSPSTTTDNSIIDLVPRLVKYEMSQRLTAQEALDFVKARLPLPLEGKQG